MANSDKTEIFNGEQSQGSGQNQSTRSNRTVIDKPEDSGTVVDAHNNASDSTVIDEARATSNASKPADQSKPKSSAWKKVMVGGICAISAGAAAAYYTHAKESLNADVDVNNGEDAEYDGEFVEVSIEPGDGYDTDGYYVVEEVEVYDDPDEIAPAVTPDQGIADQDISIVGYASGIRDDMSFGDAFAAARTEVGPGGVFEWHGQLYNTYYKEEWDAMNPEMRHEFADRAAFDAAAGHHDAAITDHMAANHDYAVVDDYAPEVVEDVAVEPGIEIEVSDVISDDENGIDYIEVQVDDEPILFVDIDQDGNIDYAVADVDGDGEISTEEIFDLSDSDISVDDILGMNAGGTLTLDDSDDFDIDFEGEC